VKHIHRWIGLVTVAAGMCLTAPVVVHAQAGRPQTEEGNRLYRAGRFEEAHQKYLEAMAASPETPLIGFNDGNALYQSADYRRALEAYQKAIESGDTRLAAASYYNLGNTLYRAEQLEESLEAYKQTLRLNPSDPDAKHNLERVLEQMQKQEEEQQQDQPQDDGEQDEQEQEQDQQQNQDGEDQEQDQGEQDQEPQDQQQNPQDQEQDQPPEAEEQEGQRQPQPQPGEMTPEEAERLLDAIDEDPGDVDRKRAAPRGRKPRKPW